MENIVKFVKENRKMLGLTQARLAMYAGVSTKFIVELEQGKKTLKMDKILDVLRILGGTIEVIRVKRT
ncbi:MAG: helix-turn-helix transcriptional regulator [Bacilli bacterium]|nr:helix-turn-helix transcriptional regulator [Bacilli bacterium]